MFRRFFRPAASHYFKRSLVPTTAAAAAFMATACYCYYHQQQELQEHLTISSNETKYLSTVFAQEKSESEAVEQTAPVYRIVITFVFLFQNV